MITLNQEEIQLACKRFAKEQYNMELPEPEHPGHGIQLRVVTNALLPGTARVEADIEILKIEAKIEAVEQCEHTAED